MTTDKPFYSISLDDADDMEAPTSIFKDSHGNENEEVEEHINDEYLNTENYVKTRVRRRILQTVIVSILLVVTVVVALAIHARDRQPIDEAMPNKVKEYQHHPSPTKRTSVTEEVKILRSHQADVSPVHVGGRSLIPSAGSNACIEYKQVTSGPDLLEASKQCLNQVVNTGCVTGLPFFIRQYQDRGVWYVICDCECGD
jgi:hypothetical protein